MSHDYRNLFRLCNLAPLNINLTLKRHDVDKLYDKSPHRNNILNILKNFKYILKLNTRKVNIYSHLMQHMSHHLHKQTSFSPHLWKLA